MRVATAVSGIPHHPTTKSHSSDFMLSMRNMASIARSRTLLPPWRAVVRGEGGAGTLDRALARKLGIRQLDLEHRAHKIMEELCAGACT